MDAINSEFAFPLRVFRELERRGTLGPRDRFLVLFAGKFDETLFRMLNYQDVEFAGLEGATIGGLRLDCRSLPFEAGAYDHVVEHAGLHHTSRPHQALCEMYRVANKSVLFFESQDSLLMRLAVGLRLAGEYEFNSSVLAGGPGGVDGTSIPNYVYRWNTREVDKVFRSLAPEFRSPNCFFRDWSVGVHLQRLVERTPLRMLPQFVRQGIVRGVPRSLNALVPSQANSIAVCIPKSSASPQPWVTEIDGAMKLDANAGKSFRAAGGLTAEKERGPGGGPPGCSAKGGPNVVRAALGKLDQR